jgi:hypothetical protein
MARLTYVNSGSAQWGINLHRGGAGSRHLHRRSAVARLDARRALVAGCSRGPNRTSRKSVCTLAHCRNHDKGPFRSAKHKLALSEARMTRLWSRMARDWAATFRQITAAIGQPPVKSVILDGEAVCLPHPRAARACRRRALDSASAGRRSYRNATTCPSRVT